MTKKQLKAKLNNIIDRKQLVYGELQGKDLSVRGKEMRSRIDAELTVFNAVLDALNNNNAMLNCY